MELSIRNVATIVAHNQNRSPAVLEKRGKEKSSPPHGHGSGAFFLGVNVVVTKGWVGENILSGMQFKYFMEL